jgi:ribonuclease HII
MVKRPATASLKHELAYHALGCAHIVGMDEVGRGPWAGPLVVGAVCLPLAQPGLRTTLAGVTDSKRLGARDRERLAIVIREHATATGIGVASAAEVNALHLTAALFLAMERALQALLDGAPFAQPDCLFLDYVLWPARRDIPQVSLIQGDSASLSVAAASILAKVWRDAYMVDLDQQYPAYGFAEHKGYGTARHRQALLEAGPCPEHRQFYAPVADTIRPTVE